MNMQQAAASLAALTILAGAPALARAQAIATDPIVVSDVQVAPAGTDREQGPALVSAAIKNTGTVAATDVVFELYVDGAYYRTINDVGNFEPGATVTHTFRVSSDESDQQLKVVSVKFANGDSWNSGAAFPATDQPAS